MNKMFFVGLLTLMHFNSSLATSPEAQDKSFAKITGNLQAGRIPPIPTYDEACRLKTQSCLTGPELYIKALDELLYERKISNRFAKKVLKHLSRSNQLTAFDRKLAELTFPHIKINWQSSQRLQAYDHQRVQELIDSYQTVHTQDWRDRYEIAKALLREDPPISDYWDGRYENTPRLYMFCRDNRQYPCLMLLRGPDGNLVQADSGELWSQPALGYSRHKKEFYQTNGNTPSGVFRIDGVMPETNKKMVFGDFRRLILNFVGASDGEANVKKLLPSITHGHQWWREGVTARNNGRGLFRIHGTGLKSHSRRPYYPLVPTSGCVAQRENKYDGVRYKDQRSLLDTLMLVSNYEPVFGNETKIRGLLYILNIDKKDAPVSLEDLVDAGIL